MRKQDGSKAQRRTEPGWARGEAAGERILVRDRHGLLWLCPRGVDEATDLAAQGCWRHDGPTPEDIVRSATPDERKNHD